MKKVKVGACHLCGQNGELSFEHVPPKKAFNHKPAFFYTGEQLIKRIGQDAFPWDMSGLKYTQSQRGFGGYTLCEKCNNDTGRWYGGAFVDFVHQGYQYIEEVDYNNLRANTEIRISFRNIYPQRIAKQILTMFCSVNPPQLAKSHPELQKLLLDKYQRGLNPYSFGILAYLGKGELTRNVGASGVLSVDTSRTRVISELSTPPFGFLLEFNPSEDTRAEKNNILWMLQEDYDQKSDYTIPLKVLETNTQYPGDYRTRQEVLNTYLQNKLEQRLLEESKFTK